MLGFLPIMIATIMFNTGEHPPLGLVLSIPCSRYGLLVIHCSS